MTAGYYDAERVKRVLELTRALGPGGHIVGAVTYGELLNLAWYAIELEAQLERLRGGLTHSEGDV